MSICHVPAPKVRRIKIPSRFLLCLQLVAHDNLTAVEDGSLFKHGRSSGEVDPRAAQCWGSIKGRGTGSITAKRAHAVGFLPGNRKGEEKQTGYSAQKLPLAPGAVQIPHSHC